VIFGKKNHPEVIGLAGQTANTAIILENADDLSQINFSTPVRLFAQTTQSPEKYSQIIALINERLKVVDEEGMPYFKAENSICRHVSNRIETLKLFASDNDVVIFVGGENSSNGKYLFGVCQQINPQAWYIQSADMLQTSWFSGAKKVGVTGATSTPNWLLAGVAKEIKSLTNQSN
jgi:4-hydroxy-3-methylbut-2-enyl diphosphate reductase